MSDVELKMLSKMTHPDVIARVWEMGLREPVFVDDDYRNIFTWMVDYWLSSNMCAAPTWVVLETQFPAVHFERTVDESTEWLISHLQERYTLNQAQELLLKASNEVNADPIATMGQLWRSAYDITETTIPRSFRSDMAENAEERQRRYEARAIDTARGMTLGLAELDEHTGGLLAGELGAVAAYTKVGKSFLLCKALTGAHLAGRRPILYTLEMSIKEMEDRVDAFYSGVSYQRLQEGNLLPQEETTWREAHERLRANGPLRIERPPRGERTVKNLCARARQTGSDFILIDQLSFMDAEGRYGGDQALRMKHGDIVFDLKDEISRESAGALPCLLAVQLNRETMRRDNGGRGQLQNFANSSFIEQTVDLALGLWRNDDMRANNVMGMDIMGSRRCDRESWLLTWRLADRTEVRIRGVNPD